MSNPTLVTATATVEEIGGNSVVGSVLGYSTTSKIGFYGLSTPIVQPTITLGAGTTTTLLAADVAAIKAALVALGLVA